MKAAPDLIRDADRYVPALFSLLWRARQLQFAAERFLIWRARPNRLESECVARLTASLTAARRALILKPLSPLGEGRNLQQSVTVMRVFQWGLP